MNKQKAIQIINDAPVDWEYFATSNERFYKKGSGKCFFFSMGWWLECEPFTPLYSSRASMMPKSEILKIAEGEEMKTYPYIGGIDSDCKTLFLDECYGIAMEHSELEITGIPEHDWSEDEFKNITHEYLQNTYGEVVSPEHAEFIVELCKAHGIKVISSIPRKCGSFLILSPGNAYFYENDISESFEGEPVKQITIPLPPKFNKKSEILNPNNADVKLTKPEPLKNAGDNLILGCEQDFKKARAVVNDLRKDMGFSDKLLAKGYEWEVIEEDVKELDFISRAWGPIESKSDEWPQVGDEVQTSMGKGNVELLPDNIGNYIVEINGVFFPMLIGELKKPKTPEEELRDLLNELWRENSGDFDSFADIAIEHVIKKPQ